MSVAFRRENDDEHLEPKFELPIPSGPNLVTRRGAELIDARVAELEEQLAGLLAGGADEAPVKALQRDLRYWQTRQVTAQPVPRPTGETAEIGTTVTFRFNGKINHLALVGHDEADPAAGRVAFSAPLARALIGTGPGEMLDFAGKEEAIEVLSITVND
ncbi:MAG: GreA/GreB family elongation factor [Sphingomonadales bacterium]|nr:GreA/GreB family elongation factor [Sphingomonadales bacterium]